MPIIIDPIALWLLCKPIPHMSMFRSRSNEFEHVVETATIFKDELDVPVFCGGVHPTIAPNDALRECFDGICIGEGEESLLELIENMEKKNHLILEISGSETMER